MSLYSQNAFQKFLCNLQKANSPYENLQELIGDYFPNHDIGCPIDWDNLTAFFLGEEQFGNNHFNLQGIRRLYYQVRGFLPYWIRPLLHKLAGRRQAEEALLSWPIERRWAVLLFTAMHTAMVNQGKKTIDYVHFWPNKKRYAFVITHDIESKKGQDFAWQLAQLDMQYGFRASFNFVPSRYPIDEKLIARLIENGFEVGIHGLKHDGKLFLSKETFDSRANKINKILKDWRAVGFRSPLTHRNPYWMQALDIEYDTSFFDTDPYEPIPGGTTSIWPFKMGRFIELPYTLAQDHTLMVTLGERTPRLWLEKVDFVRKYCGMALVNVHPDYQREPAHLAIYEEFLSRISQSDDYWHALPRDVARWWKKRNELDLDNLEDDLSEILPGATTGTIHATANNSQVELKF